MADLPADDLSTLERARERLYGRAPETGGTSVPERTASYRILPHAWKETLLPSTLQGPKRHVRIATLFFGTAVAFFLVSICAAAFFFYFGGNSVSVNKINITIQGPTSIAGGDTVPLSLTVVNKNPVALNNAVIEIDFPAGTRDASDVLKPYPRYTEDLGTIASGATVTRSIKAVIFGGEGETVTLPGSLTYSASGSNAVFVKKLSYAFDITSTPLSVSVDTISEVVSGQAFTLTLAVRSNATIPLDNVVLKGAFPFGFTLTSSSLPATNSSFFIGTLNPGASKTIKITGVLEGQNTEERAFHFTVGTAASAADQALAVTYMTQDSTVKLTAPFISTTLSLNGDTSSGVTVSPGSVESVTVAYTNTLPTTVTNATVGITVAGTAVDYNSIRTSNGFYRSSDHTIVFSRDTDASMAQLAPGASGVGSFTFSTLPATSIGPTPSLSFSISVAGTRVGQTNVPEQVTASTVKSVKVVTAVAFTAASLHSSGPIPNTGPIPPVAGQPTTYSIMWNVRNSGSAVAGGTVSAILPSYVTYSDKTSGSGSFSYDANSRTVSWSTGDLASGASVQGAFQVSLTPSTSQKGAAPALTGTASFSGYDRFAGVQISATAPSVTTETKGDPGYVANNANVQ